MKHIRPYQFFERLKSGPADRTAQIMLPRRRAKGGLTLLETSLLLCAAQRVNASSIFEFGTYYGTTTYNLALNLPSGGTAYTLDLEGPVATEEEIDKELTGIHIALAPHELDFMGTPASKQVVVLKGDSKWYDFSPYAGLIDLVFIDGGHDIVTVLSDTAAAFLMLRDRPSCIAWHDYGNREQPAVTSYLNTMSENRSLVHIEDTMLCFFMDGETWN